MDDLASPSLGDLLAIQISRIAIDSGEIIPLLERPAGHAAAR
jgi:hypothetical protein